MITVSFLILSITIAQDYVGSVACSPCHEEKYADWVDSGHPYKFTVIENGQPPTYPSFVNNFQSTWMDSLGDGTLDWSNIAGVIGGFGWKSRFVGTDGHLIGTANSTLAGSGEGHNQFNFFGGEEHGWVDYHPGDEKKYNYGCFKCHTTGGDTTGTWLAGVDGLGTFTEGGVGCEGCHGPGSTHVTSSSKDDIDRVYEYAHLDNSLGGLQLDGTVITPDAASDNVNFLCGTCHNRSYTDPINSSGGFIKHHEQWDEFVTTGHFKSGFSCITCHDPHKRAIWDGDGISKTCESCHTTQVTMTNHSSSANCVDCHMPFAAKSGTTRGASGYKGDVRSHLFAISANSESMFTSDGSAVRDDDTRSASLSPAFSCLGCHNDDPNDAIQDKTLDAVVMVAATMHTDMQSTAEHVGNEACLVCHSNEALGDMTGWRSTMHANGFSVPKGANTLKNLIGIVADANQNGTDDFKEGLSLSDASITSKFADYGTNAPVLGYSSSDDQYTVTIGDLTMPVKLTYGGSGLYKQRYMLKIPTSDGKETASHYVSPVQYNEKTHEYVAYHPEAWYVDPANGDYTPLFSASTVTVADVVASANTQKRSFEKQCVGCHFNYTTMEKTAAGEWIADAPDAGANDTGSNVYDIDGDGTLDLVNTGCERCHGPGSGHTTSPSKYNITNPANLTATQANDMCGFCHSRGSSYPNETFHFPFDDANMKDWDVGDAWADYYIDHGGYYDDGLQGDEEIRNSKKHHQQYFDIHESTKPTFAYHEVKCFECHDVHNLQKHQIRTEIVEEDASGVELVIATENDNNTLCLACHATHGDFEALTKEMIADPVTNAADIANVVSAHSKHDYDPENGMSRCSKCHMPKTIKSAVHYDIHSHTFEVISPQKTLEYGMPNACAASCHRGIENGDTPLFGTGEDASFSDWKEAADIALADTLLHYFGPRGTWWYYDQILATVEWVDSAVPENYLLGQNYPNPFNPITVIPFDIQSAGYVKIVLYNLLGEEVAVLNDGYMTPGTYKVKLNAQSFAAGMYIYSMSVINSENGISFQDSKKMVLLK